MTIRFSGRVNITDDFGIFIRKLEPSLYLFFLFFSIQKRFSFWNARPTILPLYLFSILFFTLLSWILEYMLPVVTCEIFYVTLNRLRISQHKNERERHTELRQARPWPLEFRQARHHGRSSSRFRLVAMAACASLSSSSLWPQLWGVTTSRYLRITSFVPWEC